MKEMQYYFWCSVTSLPGIAFYFSCLAVRLWAWIAARMSTSCWDPICHSAKHFQWKPEAKMHGLLPVQVWLLHISRGYWELGIRKRQALQMWHSSRNGTLIVTPRFCWCVYLFLGRCIRQSPKGRTEGRLWQMAGHLRWSISTLQTPTQWNGGPLALPKLLVIMAAVGWVRVDSRWAARVSLMLLLLFLVLVLVLVVVKQ